MVSIHQVHPDDPRAQEVLTAYIADVAGRYRGRRLDETELQETVAAFPNEDLQATRGVLLVAMISGTPVGCVGLRLLADNIGEVTRLYVAPPHRRRGLGNRLMSEVEELARNRGVRSVRLDTRHDLTEARALYARRGFREVEPFNEKPYAEHWFEKPIPQGQHSPLR